MSELPTHLTWARRKLIIETARDSEFSSADVALIFGVATAFVEEIVRADMVAAAQAAANYEARERTRREIEAACRANVRPTEAEVQDWTAAEQARAEANMRVDMARRIARARQEEVDLNRIYDEMGGTAEEGATIQ
ncbi:hypothetical protein NS365_13340 [Aureimonas ureilytica]|uniref:Uncharacterized protein n=1 Tax=Aureimonas ureilytica TaxID=401562 RepID=A0A175RMZ2_9HYPH|nr:hypothetical protein [Aureimonas ureilytica]KTR05007.1 hypothetical protein NS365_13340 [Aureimonas ureilytica]